MRYTVDEFIDRIAEPFNDYIVRIKQKYDYETAYEYLNVICTFDCVTENFIWDYDFNEGQQECFVVDYVNVDDVFKRPEVN